MPEALVSWLQQQVGVPLRQQSPVAGGCIHNAWQLEFCDGRRLFLKSNQAAAFPLLEAEADGLRALAAAAPPGLQIPIPLACSVVAQQAVLLLPWLALAPGPAPSAWQQLGQGLAQLHRQSLRCGPGQGRFGWHCANFIGATPQPNSWQQSWVFCFVEQRLGHQFDLAQAAGRPFGRAAALLQRAWQLLADHTPDPALVHGDLWSGNAGLLEGGGAALFDPAIYRADREVDLAMAQLFGGFPPQFFSAYEAEWPLPAGSRGRLELYNLYHLLNHAHLFGGGYRQQAQACMERLLG